MTDRTEADERARTLMAYVNDLATDAEVWCDVHQMARDFLALQEEHSTCRETCMELLRIRRGEWEEERDRLNEERDCDQILRDELRKERDRLKALQSQEAQAYRQSVERGLALESERDHLRSDRNFWKAHAEIKDRCNMDARACLREAVVIGDEMAEDLDAFYPNSDALDKWNRKTTKASELLGENDG